MIKEIKDDMRHRTFALPQTPPPEKNSIHKAEKEAQARRQFALQFQTLAPRQQMHIFTILNKNMFLYKNERSRNIDIDLSTIDSTAFKKIQAYLKGVKVRAKKKQQDKLLTKSVVSTTGSQLVITIAKDVQETNNDQGMRTNATNNAFNNQDGFGLSLIELSRSFEALLDG